MNIRYVQEEDIIILKPILETWIRDRRTKELIPTEVEEVCSAIKDSLQNKNDKKYFVAENQDNNVIGVMGYRSNLQDKLKKYATTDKPIELINAYVSKEHREGKGVGTALLIAIEKDAKKRGFTEVIINSGPRYKVTAWGFYTKLYGPPVDLAVGMYGEGGDAPIWRKKI